MQATDDDFLTLAQVGEIINRSPLTVKEYCKREGLIHGIHDRRLAVRRRDLDEWLRREEVAAMLAAGDYLKRGRLTHRATA